MDEKYLSSVRAQFAYYKLLGEQTFEQLSDEELQWQYNEESNSIAIILHHLSGNMKSRWTDFLTTDGEKPWRNRDQEFKEILQSRDELLLAWQEGWTLLFAALDAVNADNWNTLIYIRNKGHTIAEALNRQLAHYAYHIGQIVYIGRMIKGATWKSLSIPKGKSVTFNERQFAKKKRKEHFTDELLGNS